jgi:thioredoxin-like negative regulator of GroEL
MVREIGDELLEKEVTGKEGTVLLLAYATWCGDCKRILPVLDQFSTLAEYNRVSFLQLNVDKNPFTKMHLKVQRYPTLYLFQDGRQVAEKVAEVPAEEQKAIIKSLLSPQPSG